MEHAVDRQRRNPVAPHDFRLRKARGAFPRSNPTAAVPFRAGRGFPSGPANSASSRRSRRLYVPSQDASFSRSASSSVRRNCRTSIRSFRSRRGGNSPTAISEPSGQTSFSVRPTSRSPSRSEASQRESGRPPFPAQDFGTVGHLKHPASAVAVRVDHRGEAFAGHLERRGRKQVHKQAEYRKENVFHRETSVQNWRGQ